MTRRPHLPTQTVTACVTMSIRWTTRFIHVARAPSPLAMPSAAPSPVTSHLTRANRRLSVGAPTTSSRWATLRPPRPAPSAWMRHTAWICPSAPSWWTSTPVSATPAPSPPRVKCSVGAPTTTANSAVTPATPVPSLASWTCPMACAPLASRPGPTTPASTTSVATCGAGAPTSGAKLARTSTQTRTVWCCSMFSSTRGWSRHGTNNPQTSFSTSSMANPSLNRCIALDAAITGAPWISTWI